MHRGRRGIRRSQTGWLIAVIIIGSHLAVTPLAEATILVFDQARSGATGTDVVPISAGASVPLDYGDRAAGSPDAVPGGHFTYGNGGEGFTPNVLVDYFDGSGLANRRIAMWTNEYGDLTNVIFGLQSSNTLNVRLTADPGYAVELYHFDLAGWPNADYTINGVSVMDGGSTLFTESNVLVEGDLAGPRHTGFDFSSPLRGSDLLIQIDVSNLATGMHDNIGIDNIRFGQDPRPIPETAGCLSVLLAAALCRRRRS